jgi:methylamine dehydrogenase light chain
MAKGTFDKWIEDLTRRSAQRGSRRSFLTRLGAVMMGTLVLPLLPIDRRGGKAAAGQNVDPNRCDYWRHCSLDGNICGCCGGDLTNCPPGSSPSPSSWVASCTDPTDGQSYLIAYRDCCGKNLCGRCPCLRTEGELPLYRPEFNNDIIWCFGAADLTYHCTISPIVGRQ